MITIQFCIFILHFTSIFSSKIELSQKKKNNNNKIEGHIGYSDLQDTAK
jgi:predicted nucleic acid-binding OB-fold protein